MGIEKRSLTVKLSFQAQLDIQYIYSFISKDSEKYARILLEQFHLMFNKIKLYPNIGKISGVENNNYKNLREILHKNYRIIYLVNNEKIIIITIVHSSRYF